MNIECGVIDLDAHEVLDAGLGDDGLAAAECAEVIRDSNKLSLQDVQQINAKGFVATA